MIVLAGLDQHASTNGLDSVQTLDRPETRRSLRFAGESALPAQTAHLPNDLCKGMH